MRSSFWVCGFLGAMLIAMLAAGGCGSGDPPARPEIHNAPREDLHGAATKSLLYDFRARIRKYGVDGARRELPLLMEGFETWESQPLGQYRDTYEQIVQKLKALETSLAGSPTREQVVQAADEIGALAGKLPGPAQENPAVD